MHSSVSPQIPGGWGLAAGVPSRPGAPRLTGLGQQQVGLLAHEMGDAIVDGIDGLLHGLYSQAQGPVLLLQHGVLPEQVTVALTAILPSHPLALRGGAGEPSGARAPREEKRVP